MENKNMLAKKKTHTHIPIGMHIYIYIFIYIEHMYIYIDSINKQIEDLCISIGSSSKTSCPYINFVFQLIQLILNY